MWGTAPGLLALLTEKNQKFQIKGIIELEKVVNTEWPQISESIDLIINLAKDKNFPAHQEASRLVSKLYYYLGDQEKAVDYAISAGPTFDITLKDEFTQNVSAHCIQAYIKRIHENQKVDEQSDSQLHQIVQNVLQNLIDEHRYSACLCLAIETRFIDFVSTAIKKQPS